MSTAKALTQSLLLAVPRAFPGRARLWRRNVGGAVPIATVRAAVALIRVGRIEDGCAMLRPFQYGIAGEPDLEGWLAIDGMAVFCGVEVKAGGDRLRPEQTTFRNVLTGFGGIFVEARDVEQAVAELRRRVSQLEGR